MFLCTHSAAITYLACNIEMLNMFLSTHLALHHTSCLLRNRGMRSLLLIQLSSKFLVHLVILDVVLLSSRLLIQFMPCTTLVASRIILYLLPRVVKIRLARSNRLASIYLSTYPAG